jgi:hypothetical protein
MIKNSISKVEFSYYYCNLLRVELEDLPGGPESVLNE